MIKNKMIQRWKIKWYKDSSAWSAIRNINYIADQCNTYLQMTLVGENKIIYL